MLDNFFFAQIFGPLAGISLTAIALLALNPNFRDISRNKLAKQISELSSLQNSVLFLAISFIFSLSGLVLSLLFSWLISLFGPLSVIVILNDILVILCLITVVLLLYSATLNLIRELLLQKGDIIGNLFLRSNSYKEIQNDKNSSMPSNCWSKFFLGLSTIADNNWKIMIWLPRNYILFILNFARGLFVERRK